MGQKVRPTGFRVGVMTPWRSAWYAGKHDFSELLVEDQRIRLFIPKYLSRSKERKEQRPMISDIRIERTRERVTINVYSSRVGAIIGKKGEKIDKLTKALEKLIRRHIEIKTIEITRPEIDPQIIAHDIAEQLEKRTSFRRTIKNAIGRGDGKWSERHQGPTVRPTRRGRNGAMRKGYGWQRAAVDHPLQDRLRIYRGRDPSRQHWHKSLGQ